MKFKTFRKAYKKAEDSKEHMFTIDGLEFLTTYAKYVIEYLKSRGAREETEISFSQDNEVNMEG